MVHGRPGRCQHWAQASPAAPGTRRAGSGAARCPRRPAAPRQARLRPAAPHRTATADRGASGWIPTGCPSGPIGRVIQARQARERGRGRLLSQCPAVERPALRAEKRRWGRTGPRAAVRHRDKATGRPGSRPGEPGGTGSRPGSAWQCWLRVRLTSRRCWASPAGLWCSLTCGSSFPLRGLDDLGPAVASARPWQGRLVKIVGAVCARFRAEHSRTQPTLTNSGCAGLRMGGLGIGQGRESVGNMP